ncbi:hypothetical protein Tco_0273551 [Tanacetum coccineum]
MENLEFCDKHNIVNWEYILLGMTKAKDFEVCKITRADGSLSFHGNIQALLRRLDRQDLSQLYSLVQERFKDHPLEGHDLDLWGDLRMIFDPNEEDDIWLNQQYWELLRWKLHEYSGVHSLFLDGTSIQINMLVEKKYPLKKEILEKMINLKIEAEEERMEAKVFERILSKSKSFNSRNLRFEAFMKAFIEESKESTQSRAEKGGAKCRDKATEDSDFLLANRAQYKRMELNLPLKKSICLTQAFRSHFLLKEDRKKLKVEKEGSDVYEQNEPQIEKADQGELQLQLSIGVLRWERK